MLATLKDAFSTSFKKPLTWLALVAIPLIVALFGLLYFNTFLDPYERMKSLPVAIVNLDEGAEVDGEEYTYGEELVESILENDSAAWVIEDASIIDEGLENTDYYMAIVIPENFSELVAAGKTSEPEQASITFYKNQRKNYMMATLSSRMESALNETVNEAISAQYAEALAEGLIDASDGFAEAADGASELASGLTTIDDGTSSIVTGIDELLEGVATLATGADTLASGSEELASGATSANTGAVSVSEGTATLASGAAELSEGADALASGADALASQASSLPSAAQSLSDGISTLISTLSAALSGTSSSTGLVDAAGAVADGASQLADEESGLAAASEQIAEASEGAATLSESIESLGTLAAQAAASGDTATMQQALAQISALAGSSDDEDTLAGAASTLSTQLSAGSTSLETAAAGAESIASGAEQIEAALIALQSQLTDDDGSAAQLESGAAALAAAAVTLDGAISQVADAAASVADGAQSVSDGATTLASGTATLASGTATLASGAAELADGSNELVSGVATLSDGVSALSDGALELADGVTEAADGADELADSLLVGADDITAALTTDAEAYGEYISNPVEVEDDIYGELEYFGYGFAPLFLTLCMWLGSLLIFFIFEAFPSRAKLTAGRFAAIFGRWPAYLTFTALEALAAGGGALALGLPCTDVMAYAALFCCMGLCFVCIMQFLNLFDVIGKAVAIVLIVLQLACCAGTLPAELGSDFAATVGPMLPFYYAIDAMREVISGSNIATAWADMGMLLIIAAGAVVCSLIAYPLALKMKRSRDLGKVRDICGFVPEMEYAGKPVTPAAAPAAASAAATAKTPAAAGA